MVCQDKIIPNIEKNNKRPRSKKITIALISNPSDKILSTIYPAFLFYKIWGLITQQVQLFSNAVVSTLLYYPKKKLISLSADYT